MKLRQVEELVGHGVARVDAIRELRISEQTFQRWLKQRAIIRHWSEENGECGMGTDRLKEPERLRKAVSDLTPDKPSPS